MKMFLAAAMLLASIAVAGAQVAVIPPGPEWEKIVEGAKREKFVRVYSSNTLYARDLPSGAL